MSDTERLEAAAAKLDEWAGNERSAAAQCRQHDTPGHQDNADRVERDAAIHDGTAALLRALDDFNNYRLGTHALNRAADAVADAVLGVPASPKEQT